MGKVVLEAKIKKSNYFSDGYLIVDGNNVEGIFTLDYVKIFNEGDRLRMFLSEKFFNDNMDLCIRNSKYTFVDCNTTLYAPERYSLFNELESFDLYLFSIIQDKVKIASIEKTLSYLKP